MNAPSNSRINNDDLDRYYDRLGTPPEVVVSNTPTVVLPDPNAYAEALS